MLASFQANLPLVVIIYIVMWVLIGFSVYEDPVTIGIGLGLFLLGAPVYFFFMRLSKTRTMKRVMGEYRSRKAAVHPEGNSSVSNKIFLSVGARMLA